MVILYHYSSLLHLPPILREGLRFGEIAQLDLKVRKPAVAVSLTSQSSPDRLLFWGGTITIPSKIAVRYVCQIGDGDANLEPAKNAWSRLNQNSSVFKKALDPTGQSKWWYFYHGVIKPESFTVEFRGRDGYVPVSTDELSRVSAEVDVVRDKFVFESPIDAPWDLVLSLKDPSDESPLWLLNEIYPAERYRVHAQ